MRQLVQIFLFDVRTSFKSFLGAYMIVAPLAILLVLRSFLPAVQDASATIAVVDEGRFAVEAPVIEELDRYYTVATYASIEEMEARLRGTGSVEGLYRDPEAGQYVSVLERNLEQNTVFSAGARVVRRHFLSRDYPDAPQVVSFTSTVPRAVEGRSANPPVATMGGAIFVAFVGVISAFLIGLGVVADKEYGTDRALQVSPASRLDYYVGKSIFPLLIMLVYPAVTVPILALDGVDLLQLYVPVALSFSITLLLGLIVGALGNNENEAMGIGKTVSMVVMLGILGGTLLPDAWQWAVYWVPVYWLFDLVEDVFTASATWTDVWWKSGVMVGTTALYFAILRRRIAAGLSYG